MGAIWSVPKMPINRTPLNNSRDLRVFANSGSSSEEETTTPFPGPVFTTFDIALPTKHSYLGNDLEELNGRTLLEDGSFHHLALIPQPGIVIVPGQTIPLTLFQNSHIRMVRECVTKDRTFGVVCVRYLHDGTHNLSNIGTTAEIYEYQDIVSSPDGTQDTGFRVKAKGRQRFRIVAMRPSFRGCLQAMVMILPERILPDLLGDIRYLSVKKHFHGSKRRALARRDAMMTRWPQFVHTQYQTGTLIARVKALLVHLRYAGGCNMPTDPVELSFWVAQTIPLEEDERIMLLSLDSAIQRLRCLISILEKCGVFCCRQCSFRVAKQKDVFSMSLEGPQNMYVNPGGYLHETLTIYNATGLVLQPVPPSTESSWFPGYAWTILDCRRCREHMGWLFTAVQPDLRPQKFYGLTRRSLMVELNHFPDEAKHIV